MTVRFEHLLTLPVVILFGKKTAAGLLNTLVSLRQKVNCFALLELLLIILSLEFFKVAVWTKLALASHVVIVKRSVARE